ncbi:MAG TPA: excinuclease ABC subunit UvrA, partial [Roseiflexaceae bacterium]|nr:excinuclease ABC subunit UvrA [Roseiflexaceae bacterium]
MSRDKIVIKGAREHNLKDVDIEIPRDKLVVLTGVSGSGKSSLAFDTLYAEGQRRYVESLSAYARQFLGQMEKPKVDFIGGLSPAIAIEQKSASKNPRSTVGTVTEIYDYLRLLFARVGKPHCHQCGREVGSQSAEQMVNRVLTLPAGARFMVLAPLVAQRKGEYKDVFAEAKAEGFTRVRVDGQMYDLSQEIKLNKKVKHTIEVVVDRLVMPAKDQRPKIKDENSNGQGSPSSSVVVRPSSLKGKAQEGEQSEWDAFVTRLTDSIEQALRAGEGMIVISIQPSGAGSQVSGVGRTDTQQPTPDTQHPEEWLMSEENTCTNCGISFPELSPQMFSFNAPQGACPTCSGLGTRMELDPQLLVPNTGLTLHEGAVPYWGERRKKKDSWAYRCLVSIGHQYGFNLDIPWEQMPERARQVIIYGSGKEKVRFSWSDSGGSRGEFMRPWEGLAKEIERRYHQTDSDWTREMYASFMSEQPCPVCQGARLRPESLAVTVGDLSIKSVCALNIQESHDWALALSGADEGRKTKDEGSRNGTELHVHHNGNGNGQLHDSSLVVHRSSFSPLTPYQLEIAGEILKEIRERLGFLLNVGLHYLTLHRPAPTLSGGEAQRIRLAS